MLLTILYFWLPVSLCNLLSSQSWDGQTDSKVLSDVSAVGISLTVSYAVISLRREDGSFEDVGSIDGDTEYQDMMRHLSEMKVEQHGVPYSVTQELLHDWTRSISRKARMTLGLPEPQIVHALSQMLQRLLELPTTTPEASLNSYPLAISFPSINGLHQQHIVDAASDVGVQTLSSRPLHQPQYITAAFAGHTLGLCEKYRNEETCRREGLGHTQMQTTLLVEYTEHALLLHASVMREPFGLDTYDTESLANYALGTRRTRGREGAAMVAWAISSLVRARRQRLGNLGKILVYMTGGAVRQEVVDEVTGVLRDVADEVEVVASGTEYFTARGAAEMAWRVVHADERAEL